MKTIVYLSSGPAHLPYLVVSVRALRRFWTGPIYCFGWPESFQFLKRLEKDRRLGVIACEREPDYRGRNGQFLDKIRLMQTLSPGPNVYLDHDTIPVRRSVLDRLFALCSSSGFVATQFCHWTTRGVVANRIRKVEGRPPINQDAVQRLLTNARPSVNGGVFACHPDSPALRLWEKWTSSVLDVFIADEVVLHVVAEHCIFGGDAPTGFDIMLGGLVNCSPAKSHLPEAEVGIWHGHGDCFVRPGKSPRGVALWWPLYQSALRDNIGGIADWKDDALAAAGRNSTARYIRTLEANPPQEIKEAADVASVT